MKHEESKIQQQCVQWFRYSFPKKLIFAIPNGVLIGGNQLQRIKRWNILKAEGATSGVPDLLICFPSGQYHGLFVEMKTEKGKLSEAQKTIHSQLINSGYCVKICRSLDDFIQTVHKYVDL
jgi:hypothetical protein